MKRPQIPRPKKKPNPIKRKRQLLARYKDTHTDIKYEEVPAGPLEGQARVFMSNTGIQAVLTEFPYIHLSISADDRLPTYSELKEARYQICGEVKYMGQVFPLEDEFVNVHEYCLQLCQLDSDEIPMFAGRL